MNYRKLGKTGFEVSEISLGTWQVGGRWGSKFDHSLAESIIREAIDNGVNFIDTADVYSDGESEKAVGRAVRQSGTAVRIATKCGRQINPHVNKGYTPEVLRGYVEDSLKRLGTDCIDLIQLHCPPTEVYYRPEIFGEFEKLKQEGKILNLGVSVEKVEEAIKAIEYDNVTTVQIIYNIFRQRPRERFFRMAAEKNIGLIIRVPLASGLLSGKFGPDTRFAPGDHRFFNRTGLFFDKGETFAGVPYDTGLKAVTRLRALFPENTPLVQAALQWILQSEEVSCIIPGASSADQVKSNLNTAAFPGFTTEQMEAVNAIYDEEIKPLVHHLW
ncbi:MAG: aldo/keto reductase [Bacteroidales bacterium]|jgi:aryl-alcohol dehydrogenase-like predicted oxidoreductase|nr:aldo/keto reductase [Bacteroidales bacterium]